MKQIADYQIIQSMGSDSQGERWLAQTPDRLGVTDQVVAVKTITTTPTEENFTRLIRHLSKYELAQSDRLVRLFDVGQQGNIVYVASEYVPGGSLAAPARPLSRVDILKAVADACAGAHALHDVGVAHRSIRPNTIMLGDASSKLCELSVVQLLSPGQTIMASGQVQEIEYLPPELIQGQKSSRASDIWALGATLHRVLTGQSIFPDMPMSSFLSAVRHLLNKKPQMNDALRNGERHIIEASLALDPADRPSSAADLGKAISVEMERQLESRGGVQL